MQRRDAAAAFVVTLLLLNFMPLLSSDSDAHVYDDGSVLDGVLFYEVAPTDRNCEGFALKNYSDREVSLDGYTVKLDPYAAEKNVFDLCEKGARSIGPGDVAVFARSVSDGYWFTAEVAGERDVYTYKECDPTLTGFNLGNKAGQLYLYKDGIITDTVCYRSGSNPSGFEAVSSILWQGAPAYLGMTDDAIRRVELKDTNTAFDWIPAGRGMSSNGFSDVPSFDVQVTPFIFPDSSGKHIYEEIANAVDTIHISIYMLTSPNIISLLCAKADEGVNVSLMLESKPLGYGHTAYLLKELDSHPNTEVRFIGADRDLDRYSYVHNKYMIVDGESVVITSENWTIGNMQCADNIREGNRGWGAVVSGIQFAQYMEDEYFSNDWDYKDTVALNQRQWEEHDDVTTDKPLPTVPELEAYKEKLTYVSDTFDAKASIYMSPDNTFKSLTYFMSNAQDRVYTEQMDIGSSYSDLNNDGPLRYMAEAGMKGLDVRFMTTDSDKQILADLQASNVKAAKMANTGYATMHNKGVIIDDAVWVSSVNWTENSFVNNRECGLYLQSAQLADFYAAAYDEDWEASYSSDYNTQLVPDKAPVLGEDVVLKTKDGASGSWTVHYKDGTEKTSVGDRVTVKADDTVAYVEYASANGTDRGMYSFGQVPESSPSGPDAPSGPGTDVSAPDLDLSTKEYIEIGGVSFIALIVLLLVSKLRRR